MMFKLFFVYPCIAFVLFWLASDVDIEGSPYSFKDNHLSIEFPKKQFRSEDHPEPWYSFYWNATAAEETLIELKDAVVE